MIIIPVYNGGDYIKPAIESALRQTYANKEIIVVNDGSKDDGVTDAICRSFGNKIRYILKPNGGVSSALNCGIENMKGEYFSWLSHDDLYNVDKIRLSVEALKKVDKPNKTIVICGTKYINSKGASLSIIGHKIPVSATGIEMFRHCFLKKKSLNGSALLIPRSAFVECGTFSDLRFAQDMELWGRMMIADYNFISIPYEGSIIRIHARQATNRLRSVYFEERPKFLSLLFDAIKKQQSQEEFKKALLYVCYSTYPKPKSLISELNKTCDIIFTKKIWYSTKGIIIQKLKDAYYYYKYQMPKIGRCD